MLALSWVELSGVPYVMAVGVAQVIVGVVFVGEDVVPCVAPLLLVVTPHPARMSVVQTSKRIVVARGSSARTRAALVWAEYGTPKGMGEVRKLIRHLHFGLNAFPERDNLMPTLRHCARPPAAIDPANAQPGSPILRMQKSQV